MYPTLRFEIPNENDPFRIGTETLGTASVHVEPDIAVGGTTEHTVWVFDDPDRRVAEGFRSADAAAAVEAVAVEDDSDAAVYRVRWTGRPGGVFDCVREAEGTLLEAVGTDGAWAFVARLPSRGFEPFQSACARVGLDTAIRSVNSGPPRYRRGTPPSAWDKLTRAQAETLALAIDAGYFEVPRKASLSDLATQLGISDSAVSQRLRRGLSALLSSTDLRGHAATPRPRD
ncbi:helix-turn-helix domain-containing protein [Halobium salinum]|uniref:Helix-turn-helix domain-containing protein n=1 Tax=Halobium salinum TaxID=1364940 RepID=A0ABD5PB27_9EURY|nr:helix-turn-helix domain-containing protein [Halobium salinum]